MRFYIWISVTIFFAGFIKGLAGFGSILIALPLLVIFIDIKTVVPLTVMLATSASFFLIIQLLKDFEFKEVLPILVGSVPGIMAGVFLLKALDRNVLQLILGTFLIFYSSYSLFSGSWKISARKEWGYIFGFIAGCFGGAIGAFGPPAIVYTSLQPWSKNKIKCTLQGFFLASGLITVCLQASTGLITITVLKSFIISLPIFALGTYVGSCFYGTIGEKLYKQTIFILLGLLGALIISKVLWDDPRG